jgi:cobalt transporter subunit CbtB
MDCFCRTPSRTSLRYRFSPGGIVRGSSPEGFRMSSLPGLLDHAAVPPRTTVWKDKAAPALMAAGMGLVLLYASGFAESAALHNAAHDGRHSASFPCH